MGRCCRNCPCTLECQHHCRTHTAGNIPVFTATYGAIGIVFFLCAFCFTYALGFFCLFCSYAGGNITIFAAYRAIRIDFSLCAFCVTDTLWFFRYLRVADLAVIRARCACCCGNIPTGFVMFVFTVQFLCDAAAFLTALMGTAVSCFFLPICWQNTITVALCRMLMNAFRYQSIAILRVFMTARRFCRPFAVAASAVMLGVVFTQPTYGIRTICIHYGRHQRHQHAQADKRRKDSFSHGFLLPLFSLLLLFCQHKSIPPPFSGQKFFF